MPRWPALIVLAVLGSAILAPRGAAEDVTSLPPGVPRPLPPEQARRMLHLAPGLRIDLVASEPVVRQPVSISFDDRGRLWVLEYLQYPTPSGLKPVAVDQYLRTKYDRVPEPPPRGPRGAGKVIILEDAGADGIYRGSKEFLGNLDLASGMALGYDGLYVVMPPYLLFYPDRDHDDRPDGDPEVLLKGFGMEDAHAFANSLTWGPDGWLYGAQGSTVTARIRGIEFQQGIWRYHPPSKRFELFAEGGGNTWGIDFDRNGQLFAGGNTTEPLCHHVPGGYYWKGFSKHGPLHNPYAFGYIDPVPHRGFLGSSLTGGFVIYQGGLLPERFDGAVIYPNLRANAVRVSRLEPAGSTFTTRFQEDFILSDDRWFRPVKGLVGPDGALYLADWYDYNISHSDPRDRSKWYMPSRDTGRIWRVGPEGTTPRADERLPLGRLSSDELVGLLGHRNAWYSREARRILMERRDPSVRPRLEAMARQEKDPHLALEDLWGLYVIGGLTDEIAAALLGQGFEHVRAWTVRLLADPRQVAPGLAGRMVQLARDDPSPTVRSELACAARRLPGPVALPIVDALLGRSKDVGDRHIPLLLWWAIEEKAISDREAVIGLVDSAARWDRPIVRTAIVGRLARRYLAEGGDAGYSSCARLLAMAPTTAERERLVRAMEEQMAGLHLDHPPAPLALALEPAIAAGHPSAALVRLAARLGMASAVPIAAARAADRGLPAGERAEFVRMLGELARPGSLPVLLGLLGADEPAEVRTAAILALGRQEAPEVAEAVLSQYAGMAPAMKDRARDVLVSRPRWSAALVGAVESGRIPAGEVGLDQVRRMVLHREPGLSRRVEKLWGQVRPASSREKEGRIMAVSQILGRGPGDAAAGKPLVVKACLNCHQLFGEGAQIGPDLSAVDRKNLDVLLRNVIDPAAVIREGFQQYIVATTDGRILPGLLAEEGAEKVTVLDAKGVRTSLRRADVESMARAETSLMPEGLLDGLSDEEIRDFFAYLRSEPSRKGP